MDERTSPAAQPGKDWASRLPCHSNSTVRLHHPARFIKNDSIKFRLIIDNQLTFKAHIAKTVRSRRKIRPFLTEHASQLLIQALVISWLDYCNALLPGLPSNTIKPLQMIKNAAARLVFNEPESAHVTPLFIFLHQPPFVAFIKFNTLMLAYRTATDSAAFYLNSLLWLYSPSRSPQVSDASWHHHREAQNHFCSLFYAGAMIFPTLSGMTNPWQHSRGSWKLISSIST